VIETRRIELLGVKVWKGMVEELIFNYTNMWLSRANLGSIFGKARTVEAFYQYFLFDDIKGEIQPSQFNKVTKAVELAKHILNEAMEKEHDTTWIESKIPEILKILDLDALISIPLSVPLKGPGLAITPNDFAKAMKQVTKSRKDDFSKFDSKNVLEGKTVLDEFKIIKTENKKNEKKGLNTKSIGIKIPDQSNVDETKIYDQDLVNNLKAKFKEWKTGWKEYHFFVGDEFDNESYLEGYDRPFLTDIKKSIKTRIVILLDHSSSIADQQIDYKKATLALCEVLAFLRIKFSVYAFNTTERQVMCWLVKPDDLKWNNSCAKRLAQIPANGGTPLAEVYDKLYPILNSKKPDIFLTLSDGEPSDAFAARSMVKLFKSIGIRMVAIGVGRDTRNATIIATNLKYLGFERTLGVSRLRDIPNKVLNVLSDR
jgi:Mg-chelatase subunit ChlD